jgi:hypothetical protein
MELAEFKCEICSDSESELNVHHVCYQKGKAPWDYEDHQLTCVCNKCHKSVEKVIKPLAMSLIVMRPYPTIHIVLGAIYHAMSGAENKSALEILKSAVEQELIWSENRKNAGIDEHHE